MTPPFHTATTQISESNTILSGWRLHLARLAWFVNSGLVLILILLIARQIPRTVWLAPFVEDSYQLLFRLISYSQYINYVIFLRYLVASVFILVGIFIFWRRSNDWLAMLTSITLIYLPYLAFYNTILYDLDYPYPSPWRELVSFSEGLLITIGLLSMVRLLFIFPDGRFVPKGLHKPIKWLFYFLMTGLIFIGHWVSLINNPVAYFFNEYAWIFFLITYFSMMLLGVASQVYRYWRLSTSIQKQQTKWILFSMLVNLGFSGLGTFGLGSSLRFGSAALFGLLWLHASFLVVLLLPLSLAFSVLRYRLWDIDVIIRRTLLYSTLTGALSLLYFGGVAMSQALLTSSRSPQTTNNAVESQTPTIVIVATTLVIAALFNPLRRRFQDAIDQRFYRQKYDAEKALAAFTTSTRSETDLQMLTSSMVYVIQNTLHPQTVSVWFCSDGTKGRS